MSLSLVEFEITQLSDPFAVEAQKILGQELLPDDYSDNDFIDRMTGQLCVGAVKDCEELLGIGTMSFNNPMDAPFDNSAFLDLIAVHDSYRQTYGIGSRIMKRLLNKALEDGFSSVHGLIENDSDTFHERFGARDAYVTESDGTRRHYMILEF